MPAYGLTSRCVQKAVLPFSAGCIHRHEWKRTLAADSGRSDVAGAGGSGSMVLLKLNANSLLQRAKGADFLGSHERQRMPG